MKGRILVLDNSNPHKMELTTILNDQFDVVVVKNHFDAVELCEYWSPDILVMDIDEITSGLDACRFLRNLTETPILFSAADCSAETQMAVFEAGANDIFVKPVTPSARFDRSNKKSPCKSRAFFICPALFSCWYAIEYAIVR